MKLVVISAIWCSGCLKMKKVWKKIEQEYPNIEIEYLDLDMDEEVQTYEVGNILPVAILIKDKEEKRWVGEHTYEEIAKELSNE